MNAISIIFKRELKSYLISPLGYVIGASVLFIDGLLFYTQALGGRPRLSEDVLSQFFYFSSGVTMIAAVLLSMRLIAQERHSGTLVLLKTSPVRDIEIVLGKFLSALAFLLIITALTIYLPLLILMQGKISIAHILVGYSGLVLLSAASLAIGMFATAIASEQLIAGIISAVTITSLLAFYYLSKQLNEPLRTIFEGLSFHHKNFFPFMHGVLHMKYVVYHLAVTYFFLLLAVKIMEAKRWR